MRPCGARRRARDPRRADLPADRRRYVGIEFGDEANLTSNFKVLALAERAGDRVRYFAGVGTLGGQDQVGSVTESGRLGPMAARLTR